MNELTNVTTGRARLSYVHLFKPYAYQSGAGRKIQRDCPGAEKMMWIQKPASMRLLKRQSRKGSMENGTGSARRSCLPQSMTGMGCGRPMGCRLGRSAKGTGSLQPAQKTDYPPEVVDKMGNPIINHSEVYSGIYGRVNVSFYPYMYGRKKGIGCSLNAVQKLEDGEPLGSTRPTAAQAFGFTQPVQPAQTTQQTYQQPAQQATYMTAPAVDPITGLPY